MTEEAPPMASRHMRVLQQQQEQESQTKRQQLIDAHEAIRAGIAAGRPDDRVWVQCNKCDKWRALPSTVDAAKLPEEWLCEYNVLDPNHASCDVPEEAYIQPDMKLKVCIKCSPPYIAYDLCAILLCHFQNYFHFTCIP
jgi:hypothetical protein